MTRNVPAGEPLWEDAIHYIQLYSAGLCSRRSAIEAIGHVVDVEVEMERIEAEEIDRRIHEGRHP